MRSGRATRKGGSDLGGGARYPGRALGAELTGREGTPTYRIKWLGEDGTVREVTADARTGRILAVR